MTDIFKVLDPSDHDSQTWKAVLKGIIQHKIPYDSQVRMIEQVLYRVNDPCNHKKILKTVSIYGNKEIMQYLFNKWKDHLFMNVDECFEIIIWLMGERSRQQQQPNDNTMTDD
jgi:hypothetical protein